MLEQLEAGTHDHTMLLRPPPSREEPRLQDDLPGGTTRTDTFAVGAVAACGVRLWNRPAGTGGNAGVPVDLGNPR